MHLKLDAKMPGRVRNRPLKDYAGTRSGRLVAVRLVEPDPVWACHKWLFACDCGGEVVAGIKNVLAGKTGSCGCLASERLVERNTTHGLSRQHPREYRSWKDMRSRCGNPNDSDYASYGGRGIRVCERWSGFAAFLADMGERPAGQTIDRRDVDGDYTPDNCRWATAKTQANNKTTSHRIEIDGVERTLQEWSEHFGVESSKVRWRLKQDWSPKQAFSQTDHRKVS